MRTYLILLFHPLSPLDSSSYGTMDRTRAFFYQTLDVVLVALMSSPLRLV